MLEGGPPGGLPGLDCQHVDGTSELPERREPGGGEAEEGCPQGQRRGNWYRSLKPVQCGLAELFVCAKC